MPPLYIVNFRFTSNSQVDTVLDYSYIIITFTNKLTNPFGNSLKGIADDETYRISIYKKKENVQQDVFCLKITLSISNNIVE